MAKSREIGALKALDLDHIVYGKLLVNGHPTGEFDALALSAGLSPGDAARWHDLITLEPLAEATVEASRAIGIFEGSDNNFILARTYNQTGDLNIPIYEYVLLPREFLAALEGNLAPLVAQLAQPLPTYSEAQSVIEPLSVPPPQPRTKEEQITLFATLLEQYGRGDIARILALLAAALDERRLLLHGFPNGVEERVRLVEGLMALLPAPVRAELTFSTNVSDTENALTRIVFCEEEAITKRWVAEWTTPIFPNTKDLQQPYIAHLSDLWTDDVPTFLAAIGSLGDLAANMQLKSADLKTRLGQLAERHKLDQRVFTDAEISAEALKKILTGDNLPEGDLQRRYAERLLYHALDTRETEAVLIVTKLMDSDETLDSALDAILNEELDSQPDAVYAFVRARLHENIDERWLPRLKLAAMYAMRIAITDGDLDTANNWFTLIAREPAAYELSELLGDGILAALPRAYESDELATLLISLAVRRAPEALETLLNDEKLLAALPEELRTALQEHTGDALAIYEAYGRELFLLILGRAVQARQGSLFSAACMQQFWALYDPEHPGNHLIPAYYPETLIENWINDGVDYLSDEAVKAMLTAMLANTRDDSLLSFMPHLVAREALPNLLASALENSRRDINDILDLVGQLSLSDYISQQQALDVYVMLMRIWNWAMTGMPIMEQMARLLQQHPELNTTPDVLWHLLEAAEEAKDEMPARVAARRLLAEFEPMEDETVLVDTLERLNTKAQWSANLRRSVLEMWRKLARRQALARLQRIDKVLEGRRFLEEAHEIVGTILAFRRMLGQHSLNEFATALSTAHEVIEALVESFDPTPKRPPRFDQETIRAEIDTQAATLSPNEQQIFANNLKELAQLITDMAEHRSKAQVLRRGEGVTRKLMSGAQQPQSAIDAMKWLSGYLGGVQAKGEDTED